MARASDTHSRVVTGLKVLLPLAALAILSSVFLLATPRTARDTLTYAPAELDRLVNDRRVVRPSYAGVDHRGAAIAISAEAAQADADDPGRMLLEGLTGSILLPDGGAVDLRAPAGSVNDAGRRARLTGGVRIDTSSGYRIDAAALDTALDAVDVVSNGPVRAAGPPGTLTAGAMTLTSRGARDVVRFSGGVKLVYDPATRTGAPNDRE